MRDLCVFMTKETNAVFSFVQSDEITLCYSNATEFIFDYRIHKIVGEFVKLASLKFDRLLKKYYH